MEKDGQTDGHHQALLPVPGHGCEFEADGSVWREAFYRYQRLGDSYFNCYCLFFATIIGTLFRASQFLSEELPIRLAHRVQELGDLPDSLNEMPSIKKVQDWYAQSFEVYEKSGRRIIMPIDQRSRILQLSPAQI